MHKRPVVQEPPRRRGASCAYKVLEPFTAVEAMDRPTEVHDRYDWPPNARAPIARPARNGVHAFFAFSLLRHFFDFTISPG